MVHQYQSGGLNIVLDVTSGAVHIVDDLVYRMIPVLEPFAEPGTLNREDCIACAKSAIAGEYTDAEIEEAADEILSLMEGGMLYTSDIYETYIDSFKNRETVVKALCLHISRIQCLNMFHRKNLLMFPDHLLAPVRLRTL